MPFECIQCGEAELQPRLIQLDGPVRGKTYNVEMMGLVCPQCGYKTIEGSAMPEFARLLADKFRAAHGLLTSSEIRFRRKELKMSQDQFARYIGVGVASIKRWEMGKIQDWDSNQRIVQATSPTLKDSAAFAVAFPGTITSTSGFYVQVESLPLPTVQTGSVRSPKFYHRTISPHLAHMLNLGNKHG